LSFENDNGKGEQSHASAAVRGTNEILIANEFIEVPEAGPSFRFMAEGNMWLLGFEASGLRVLADPWILPPFH